MRLSSLIIKKSRQHRAQAAHSKVHRGNHQQNAYPGPQIVSLRNARLPQTKVERRPHKNKGEGHRQKAHPFQHFFFIRSHKQCLVQI